MPENCPYCGADSPPNAIYCQGCGQRLQPHCPSCHAPYTAGSRFCASCGAALVNPAGASIQDVEAAAAPNLLVCPRCQARDQPGAIYCYACGFPLQEGTQAAATLQTSFPAYAGASPGGFWVRLLAYLIDLIVLLLGFYVFWSLVSWGPPSFFSGLNSADSGEFFRPFVEAAYYTFTIGIWGATAGKRFLGLRVVRPDGAKVGLGRALVRYLCYYLSFLILGIGFLMIAFRRDKRGLHDLLCDTVVIKR